VGEFPCLGYVEHRGRLDARHLAIFNGVGGDDADTALAFHHGATGFQPAVVVANLGRVRAGIEDALAIRGGVGVEGGMVRDWRDRNRLGADWGGSRGDRGDLANR
jgi:hypothetical protein